MKRDRSTLDLFKDFVPGPVVPRFAEEEVKSWTRARRLKRAIAKALGETETDRETIARAMTEWSGEAISKAMLDNYASQGKEHQISALRLVALVAVTGDPRALNAVLGEAGLIAIDQKYEPLLRREAAREARERLEQEERAADAEWRAKR